MATKNFSTMTADEAAAFSIETDILSFSIAAAALAFFTENGKTEFTAAGKTLKFDFALTAQTAQKLAFTDNSKVVIGATSGSETLDGGQSDDQLRGGDGIDIIFGNGGADRIYGNAGDDHIYFISGDPGKDTVFAGTDNDIVDYSTSVYQATDPTAGILIYGNLGSDTLVGSDGRDTIYGGKGSDLISGGPGDDFVVAGSGADRIDGQGGNDTIRGGTENDTIVGGAGDDLLYGNTEDDLIHYVATVAGGSGHDTVYGGTENDTINYQLAEAGGYFYGNLGFDFIHGSTDDDAIFGGQGSDMLRGHAGNDIILGGDGSDDIDGGPGDDAIDGGAGDDWIVMGEQQIYYPMDTIHAGHDLIKGGAGSDYIYYSRSLDGIIADGGEGNDVLLGGYGGDVLTGGDGADSLSGGGGTDLLDGGAGDDTISISDYIDNAETTIIGGAGKDRLNLDLDAENGPLHIVINTGDSPYLDNGLPDRHSDMIAFFRSGTDHIVTGIAGTANNFSQITTETRLEGYALAASLVQSGKTYVAVLAREGQLNIQFVVWDSDGDHVIDQAVNLGLNGVGYADFI